MALPLPLELMFIRLTFVRIYDPFNEIRQQYLDKDNFIGFILNCSIRNYGNFIKESLNPFLTPYNVNEDEPRVGEMVNFSRQVRRAFFH